MTKKLCDQLIAWYEESIEQIDQVPAWAIDGIQEIVAKRTLRNGICICASIEFNDSDVYWSDWVQSFNQVDGSKWWFGNKTPGDCDTKEEVIELLQKRVDRLKTFSEADQKPAI